jgi:hypothetical protein
MAFFTEEERRELQELAASKALREDLQTLARRRIRHFLRDGQVDIDRILAFLTDFNEMINHQPKPFKAIIDHDMRL